MKEMIKKAGITFWFNAVAAVLSLVALILFAVTNGTQGYSVYNGGLGIALSVLGLIAVCGMTVSSLKFGSQHFLTALRRSSSCLRRSASCSPTGSASLPACSPGTATTPSAGVRSTTASHARSCCLSPSSFSPSTLS